MDVRITVVKRCKLHDVLMEIHPYFSYWKEVCIQWSFYDSACSTRSWLDIWIIKLNKDDHKGTVFYHTEPSNLTQTYAPYNMHQ